MPGALNQEVHLSSKGRHKKAQLTEAQFGPVLNWASIAQSSSQTAVIEEVDVGVQQSWNIFCVGQIEVEEQFFFDPSVQSFYDRVIGYLLEFLLATWSEVCYNPCGPGKKPVKSRQLPGRCGRLPGTSALLFCP